MTWFDDYRENIDATPPEKADERVAEAVEYSRRLRDPLPPEQRARFEKIVGNNVVLAVHYGGLVGARRVRSIAERHVRARSEAADSFADRMSLAWMRYAGFDEEDFEMTRQEVEQLLERELSGFLRKLRAEIEELLQMEKAPEEVEQLIEREIGAYCRKLR